MTEASPGTFIVTRSTVIAAPPEAIFPLIDDFHGWEGWSPWEKVPGDALAKTYSGAPRGVGAIYAWTGKKTGQGRMEITGSTPSSRVDIDLQFIKPFKTNNMTWFTLTPAPVGVQVTWTMTGKTTLISRLMSLVMSMDKAVGGAFAQGLATLKTIAEG